MLQRIQSLYLVVVCLAAAFLLKVSTSLWKFLVTKEGGVVIAWLYSIFYWVYVSYCVAIMLLALYVIAQHSDRKLQLRLCQRITHISLQIVSFSLLGFMSRSRLCLFEPLVNIFNNIRLLFDVVLDKLAIAHSSSFSISIVVLLLLGLGFLCFVPSGFMVLIRRCNRGVDVGILEVAIALTWGGMMGYGYKIAPILSRSGEAGHRLALFLLLLLHIVGCEVVCLANCLARYYIQRDERLVNDDYLR